MIRPDADLRVAFSSPAATIPIRYAREILVQSGVSVGPALDAAHVPVTVLEEDAHRITAEQMEAVTRAVVAATSDEGYGYFPRCIPRGTFATAVHIGSGCRDLRSFLEASTDLYTLFAERPVWALEVDGRRATIRFLPHGTAQEQSLYLAHSTLLGPWRTAMWLANASIALSEVELPAPFEPFASEANFLFGMTPKASGQRCAITFDASVLDARISRTRAEVIAWTRRSSFTAMIARAPTDSVEARVRTVLAAARPFGEVTLPAVARQLGMSQQTLGRHLRALGITFQQLKDRVRRDHAVALLSRGLPVVEVAESLGFSESSAFSRAFKAWTGSAPTRYVP